MSKTRNLAKTTAILSVGKLCLQAATFIVLALYTFYLSKHEYGVVDLLLTYVSLLLPIATLRLEAAVFRYITEKRQIRDNHISYAMYALRITGCVLIIMAIIAAITSYIYNEPLFLVVWLLLAVQALQTVFMEYVRGIGATKRYAAASIIQAILLVVLSIIFVIIVGLKVHGVLMAMLLSSLGALVWSIMRTADFMRDFTKKQNRVYMKKHEMLRFSLPLVPSTLSWWVINAADRTIIAVILGVGATGVFAVASKFAAILMVIFPIFGMALTESAILHIDKKDSGQFFSKTFDAAIRASVSLALLIVAGAAVFLPLVIGPEFMEARRYIPILVIATLFNNIVGLYSAIYIAKKMTRQIMTMSFVAAGISIVMTLVGIHIIGLYAAAISTLMAYLVMALWRHIEIKRLVDIKYDRLLLWGIVMIVALATLLYYANNDLASWTLVLFALVTAFWLNRKVYFAVRRSLVQRFKIRN